MDVVQLIIGSSIALFIPGFALSLIFFPDIRGIDYKERLSLSLVLSYLITIFMGFLTGGSQAVADVTGGVDKVNYWILVTLISTIFFGIAVYRRKRICRSTLSPKSVRPLATQGPKEEDENSVFDLSCIWMSLGMLVLGSTSVLVGSFYRSTLPMTYFIGYVLIAISIAILVARKNKLCIFAVAVFGGLLRFFPMIGENIILLRDPTLNYMTATIFEYDRYFHPILDQSYHIQYIMKQYSGFPGVHMYALATSTLTRIPLFYLFFIFLPIVLYIIQFLFIERIANTIFDGDYAYTPHCSVLATLIFAVWPIAIFCLGIHGLIGQNAAFTLMLAVFYYYILSVKENASQKSRVYTILYFLCYCGIVVSHHLTTVVIIFFFAFMGILMGLIKILLKTFRPKELSRSFIGESSLKSLMYRFRIYSVLPFLFVALLFWFTWPREVVFIWSGHIRSMINSLLNALTGNLVVRETIGIERLLAETPLYTRLIPILRDSLLGTLAMGGAWLSLKRIKNITSFVMINVTIFLSTLMGLGIFGITLAPDRCFLFLVLPCAVFSVLTLYNKRGKLYEVLGFFCIIFLVLSASFSLWSFSNSPLNVYGMSDDPLYAKITSSQMINLGDISEGLDWLNKNHCDSYCLGTDFVLHMALMLSKNANTYYSVVTFHPMDLPHWSENTKVYIVDRPYIDQEEPLRRMQMKMVYHDAEVSIYETQTDYTLRNLDRLLSILSEGEVLGFSFFEK